MSNEDRKEQFRQRLLERQSEARVVRRIVFVVFIILALTITGIIGGGYFYIKSALQPVDLQDKEKKPVEIPIGSSVTSIANILEENGIIKDAKIFKYYVKFKNESGFMAGDYELSPSMEIPKIISSLKTGKIVEEVKLKITIPEGKQLEQIAGILAEKTNQTEEEVFKTLNDEAFIKKMMTKHPDILTADIFNDNVKYPLEGYLFPATYPFYKEDPSVEVIVDSMLKKTAQVLSEYRGQMEEQQMSVHELLTMSSLIEEEATEKAHREDIASVFYNRMNIGMPLQTDPTVLYAQGEHKSKTTYKDLEVDSPYNTYKVQGLPPGPIANAGAMSITAALNPAETDYLYFLASSAGDVYFSKTLDEHNRLKAKYITGQ